MLTPDELTQLKDKFSKLSDVEKDYVAGITAAVTFTSKAIDELDKYAMKEATNGET